MKPQDDPTIESIREVRHRISQECEHDPQKLVAYYLELQQRQEAGRSIKALREEIAAKYGVIPDSTELVREDRAR